MVVVLPAPFGPTKPVTVPGAISKLSRFTATRVPNLLVSLSSLTLAVPCPPPCVRIAVAVMACTVGMTPSRGGNVELAVIRRLHCARGVEPGITARGTGGSAFLVVVLVGVVGDGDHASSSGVTKYSMSEGEATSVAARELFDLAGSNVHEQQHALVGDDVGGAVAGVAEPDDLPDLTVDGQLHRWASSAVGAYVDQRAVVGGEQQRAVFGDGHRIGELRAAAVHRRPRRPGSPTGRSAARRPHRDRTRPAVVRGELDRLGRALAREVAQLDAELRGDGELFQVVDDHLFEVGDQGDGRPVGGNADARSWIPPFT